MPSRVSRQNLLNEDEPAVAGSCKQEYASYGYFGGHYAKNALTLEGKTCLTRTSPPLRARVSRNFLPTASRRPFFSHSANGSSVFSFKEKGTESHLFVRYGILYMLLGGANLLAVDISQWDAGRLFKLFVLMITIGIDLSFCIHVLLKVFRKDKMLFYEKWSGTRHVIVTQYGRFCRGS
jgi:hypothetical protein